MYLDFLAHLVVSAALLMIVAYTIKGFEVDGAFSALLGALILGLANVWVKPILTFFSIPLIIATFGLFYFVVSALTLKLAAWLVPGFSIRGLWPAIWGALLLALLNLGVEMVMGGWS